MQEKDLKKLDESAGGVLARLANEAKKRNKGYFVYLGELLGSDMRKYFERDGLEIMIGRMQKFEKEVIIVSFKKGEDTDIYYVTKSGLNSYSIHGTKSDSKYESYLALVDRPEAEVKEFLDRVGGVIDRVKEFVATN